MFQGPQGGVVALHLGFVVALPLLGLGKHGVFKPAGVGGQGAEYLAQGLHEKLRPLAEQGKGFLQCGLVHFFQVWALAGNKLGDVGNKVGPQLRHALDLGAIEGRSIGIDQAQQLVSVRPRHHQHELNLPGTVELVAGRLECSHGGFARLAGQGVLRFVDDQCHRALAGFHQGPQSVGKCGAVYLADFGSVDFEATHADAFQPGGLGCLGDDAQLIHEGAPHGLGNQTTGVALLVGPQVHVHHHHVAAH